jgi:hypothetical protein
MFLYLSSIINHQRIIWAGYTVCTNTGCTYRIYYSTNNGASYSAITTEPGTSEASGFVGLGDQGLDSNTLVDMTCTHRVVFSLSLMLVHLCVAMPSSITR